MASIGGSPQFKEINYNLDIMKKSLDEGKAVDIGFIEIFANDIAQIGDRKLQSELSSRLMVLSAKIYDITERQLFPARSADAIRPLVGKETELKQVAAEYKNGQVKQRLEKLDATFIMRPIAGDGHCLFRAITVGILEFLQSSNAAVQKSFLEKIHSAVDRLKTANPSLETKYKLVLELMNQLSSKKTTLDAVLNERQTSDTFVDFLRDLAATYNEVEGGEVFESVAVDAEGSKEAYLLAMRDMQSETPGLGGEPELIALMRTLDIELIEINIASVSVDTTDPQSYIDKANASGKLALFLLYRPGHYDLAIARALQS